MDHSSPRAGGGILASITSVIGWLLYGTAGLLALIAMAFVFGRSGGTPGAGDETGRSMAVSFALSWLLPIAAATALIGWLVRALPLQGARPGASATDGRPRAMLLNLGPTGRKRVAFGFAGAGALLLVVVVRLIVGGLSSAARSPGRVTDLAALAWQDLLLTSPLLLLAMIAFVVAIRVGMSSGAARG